MLAPARFWFVACRGVCVRSRAQLAALSLTAIAAALLLPGPWDAPRAEAAKVQVWPQRELVELRSAKTKTFRQPDGSLKTTLSEQSFHYFDRSDRKWKEIDASFTQSAKTGVAWESGKNRFAVEVKDTLGAGFLSLDTADGSLSLALEGALPVKGAKTKGNAVLFKDALPDVDIEYVLLPDKTGVRS